LLPKQSCIYTLEVICVQVSQHVHVIWETGSWLLDLASWDVEEANNNSSIWERNYTATVHTYRIDSLISQSFLHLFSPISFVDLPLLKCPPTTIVSSHLAILHPHELSLSSPVHNHDHLDRDQRRPSWRPRARSTHSWGGSTASLWMRRSCLTAFVATWSSSRRRLSHPEISNFRM
jgi:hypothetical protein